MSQRTLKVGSKYVLTSLPYTPAGGADKELVGRESELRLVLAAWMGQPAFPPLAPLLVGEPGVGKNHLAYELARYTGKALYVLQGHEDVTAEDLVCAVRFSDDPERKMDYVLSPLATAMLRGGIAFMDEIGKLRPRALAPLASVLDERRYLDSSLLGERIDAHPGFRFLAATNLADMASESLPEFVRSRLRPVIEVKPPSETDLRRIVKRRFRWLQGGDDALIGRFWDLWGERRGRVSPVPRDVIYLFGLAQSLADMEARDDAATDADRLRPIGRPPEARHLEQAFDELFEEEPVHGEPTWD
jgi:MoxR-like ATPase